MQAKITPIIDKVSWAKVRIDAVAYHQVLISENKVWERDAARLNQLFGTTHQIGDWEQKILLASKPEAIIIATGWNGVLRIDERFKVKIEKAGIKLMALLTPQAVRAYNRLTQKGQRINALIHTTC